MVKDYSIFTDHQLLDFLSNREEFAFTEIYNRYWKKLYAISYNRLKDNAISEDVVHDVFLALWNNAELQNIQNLSSYLSVAVKFKVLRKIRDQIKENELEFHPSYQTQKIYSTEDELEYKFLMQNLEEHISHLPEKVQLIFRYSRIEHKTSKEIGEILNLSHRTVENQISKALTYLRTYFKHIYIFVVFFLK